jgi:hypothetical protein
METRAAFPGAHALPAEISAAFQPDPYTKITILEAKGKQIRNLSVNSAKPWINTALSKEPKKGYIWGRSQIWDKHRP